jgi:hypothetical protein
MEDFHMARKCKKIHFPSVKNCVTNRVFEANILRCFACLLFVVAGVSCFNPFFPPTDVPPVNLTSTNNSLRSSPQGVIKQLIDAYQKKDFEFYQDLFSVNKDFRFYVSPAFTYEHTDPTCERVDSMCHYIIGRGLSCLNYWTYSEELKSHTNLFERAEKISLTLNGIDPGNIRYIVNDHYETTNVEVIVDGGSLSIEHPIEYDQQGNPFQYKDQVDNIGVQVFYLEKDPQNPDLWVIFKWFDLNTIS